MWHHRDKPSSFDLAETRKALKAAVKAVMFDGLEALVKGAIFSQEVEVLFLAPSPTQFTFWKSEWKPANSEYDLHIVPGYHPIMRGRESEHMINGDTDYLVRGNVVTYVRCPRAAQADLGGKYRSTTFSNVIHPYRASGSSFELTLKLEELLKPGGIEELAAFVRAALGLDGDYVEVSGGFHPPLHYPHNRLVQTDTPSPWPRANNGHSGHLARGSEAHCVWAYRTLEREGELADAFIPSWFEREGWLKIYEGAETYHGLY